MPSNHLPINLCKSKSSGVAGNSASVTLSARVCNCSGGMTSASVVPLEMRRVIEPAIRYYAYSRYGKYNLCFYRISCKTEQTNKLDNVYLTIFVSGYATR